MPVFPRLVFLLLIGLAAAAAQSAAQSAAYAADVPHRACLTKSEQRAALASGQAIPLAQAIKSVRGHHAKPEVVRARLCHRGNGLVYVLTVLTANGKVTRATVDAVSGERIKGH